MIRRIIPILFLLTCTLRGGVSAAASRNIPGQELSLGSSSFGILFGVHF